MHQYLLGHGFGSYVLSSWLVSIAIHRLSALSGDRPWDPLCGRGPSSFVRPLSGRCSAAMCHHSPLFGHHSPNPRCHSATVLLIAIFPPPLSRCRLLSIQSLLPFSHYSARPLFCNRHWLFRLLLAITVCSLLWPPLSVICRCSAIVGSGTGSVIGHRNFCPTLSSYSMNLICSKMLGESRFVHWCGEAMHIR